MGTTDNQAGQQQRAKAVGSSAILPPHCFLRQQRHVPFIQIELRAGEIGRKAAAMEQRFGVSERGKKCTDTKAVGANGRAVFAEDVAYLEPVSLVESLGELRPRHLDADEAAISRWR